jgi:hypothetical protein
VSYRHAGHEGHRDPRHHQQRRHAPAAGEGCLPGRGACAGSAVRGQRPVHRVVLLDVRRRLPGRLESAGLHLFNTERSRADGGHPAQHPSVSQRASRRESRASGRPPRGWGRG